MYRYEHVYMCIYIYTYCTSCIHVTMCHAMSCNSLYIITHHISRITCHISYIIHHISYSICRHMSYFISYTHHGIYNQQHSHVTQGHRYRIVSSLKKAGKDLLGRRKILPQATKSRVTKQQGGISACQARKMGIRGALGYFKWCQRLYIYVCIW